MFDIVCVILLSCLFLLKASVNFYVLLSITFIIILLYYYCYCYYYAYSKRTCASTYCIVLNSLQLSDLGDVYILKTRLEQRISL